ncbi:F-box/LRR-repeat protein At3g48880-like [Typha latifolia]|uniref:F-box/LRR-repeat protein At3g48880-like n=1 Tax=Typha latifolia TaxID=4733 RepID=UPI003C2CCDA5
MEAERGWEEMDMDCLVNIFGRLGLEDLTLGVPFVCKTWCAAAVDPLCWRTLNLRDMDFMPWSNFAKSFVSLYSLPRFSFSGFLKFCVARSHGGAVDLEFPPLLSASSDDLLYIANECPRLQRVVLPNILSEDEPHLPEIFAKWKDLEWLEMATKPSSFLEVVTQISASCKNFVGLSMSGSIKKRDAMAIVELLPQLKCLCLNKSYLPKEELLIILSGCKNLERLSVKDCVGFELDVEVMNRGKGVGVFEREGSKLFDEFGYETDECDPLYVHVI